MACGVYAFDALIFQRQLAAKTVRLHVVANSDTEEDQAQKLRVRDAVLEKVSVLTENCADADEAKRVLSANLEEIQHTAKAVLQSEGSTLGVDVSLGTERFDTRYYDTFTLPAGDYPSLRVKIGAAEGENWWCVVFPSLCSAATSDAVAENAQVGGFDSSETDVISGGEEEYKLRFKTLEWIKGIADWFD